MNDFLAAPCGYISWSQLLFFFHQRDSVWWKALQLWNQANLDGNFSTHYSVNLREFLNPFNFPWSPPQAWMIVVGVKTMCVWVCERVNEWKWQCGWVWVCFCVQVSTKYVRVTVNVCGCPCVWYTLGSARPTGRGVGWTQLLCPCPVID